MKKVILLGDTMLDKFVVCSATKISEEAPVLVGKVVDYAYNLGGAGNLAINLKNLGIEVDIISIKNNDSAGKIVDDLFMQSGINQIKVDGGSFPTIVKTRYMIGDHQIIRVDEENSDDKLYSLEGIVDFNIYDTILISDYAKGYINDKIIKQIWKSPEQILIINGKPKNIELYRGCDYLVMNEKEVNLVLSKNYELIDPCDICSKFEILKLVMTKGGNGISVYNSEDVVAEVPAEKVDVKSTIGCGDVVTASLTYGLLNDFVNDKDLISFANKMAGIKCTKKFTNPIKLSDIPNFGE
jgi:rfaE bifunctional protein kinase chain/domain